VKRGLSEIILTAIRRGQEMGEIAEGPLPSLTLEYPKEEKYGDYATNIAMIMASKEGKSPRELAKIILRWLKDEEEIIERVEVAGPGFINFFLKEDYWCYFLKEAEQQGKKYGDGKLGKGERVLLEFLSANPTGPLHIGHGRIAAFGDALANIMEKVGYKVEREYYINDIGTQMKLLGRSVYLRYLQKCGKEVEFSDNGYQGEYVREIASQIAEEEGDKYLLLREGEVIDCLGKKTSEVILEWIKDDLKRFRVHFDRWYKERELYREDFATRILGELQKRGYIYEAEGALWFKSTSFGDEKDRVVVRANGATTYFASDIAYHKVKYDRGYNLLVNIWGADHHGYLPRMEAAIQAMGCNKSSFKVILVQLVNLWRGGKQVSMSTRTGEFTSLREVMDEVGVDACRYFFMLRRQDSPLDFDLELAKREGTENPVYYVQYAHARIASILKKAEEKDVKIPAFDEVDISLLRLPEEKGLIKRVVIFPELLEGIAVSLEPHRITYYLQDLAGLFHSYYNKHRVISENKDMTNARFLLVKIVKGVLQNSLGLLGIAAPEEM